MILYLIFETVGGVMTKLIEHNTPISKKKIQGLSTYDNQLSDFMHSTGFITSAGKLFKVSHNKG